MNVHRALAVLAAAFLLPGALAAQLVEGLGTTFRISPPFVPTNPANPEERMEMTDTAPAALGGGDFAVAWRFDHRNNESWKVDSGVAGRLIGPSLPAEGVGFGGIHNVLSPYDEIVGCPGIAATGGGGFVLVHSWSRSGGNDLLAWRFGPGAVPLDPWPILVGEAGDPLSRACPVVAGGVDGRFVVAWRQATGVQQIRAYSPAGAPLGPPFPLGAPAPGNPLPAVGLDGSGRFVVLWRGTAGSDLLGRRFDTAGAPLGPPFLVGELGEGPSGFGLAMAEDGGFAAAWSGPEAGGTQPLFLRRFAAGGTPAGPPVEVGRVDLRDPEIPQMRADRHGNFALLWWSDSSQLQLFNRALVPQGEAAVDYGWLPFTLADSGQLLFAWEGWAEASGRIFEVYGDLSLAARHEADLCLYRGGRFLCDTAGEGKVTEEIQLGLGMPRFVPLLGDIDGDGRADPCVRRGDAFSCDVAHDGGGGEVLIHFGLPGDVPLLADVDGDGRADPCVRRGSRFLCDTAHDGGAPEVTIAFGRADDLALLGDVDGDGRADPCVYRQGIFLCDTAHDGGTAEVRLDLRPALGGATAGVPLLGDVFGIGRAGACLYRQGSLVCGQFPKTGGRPLSTFTRATAGQPGDVPLLGDLDAF